MSAPGSAPVIVVGGGLAGLAAARFLESAGVATTLLEADSGPGGRLRPVHVEGTRVEPAVSTLPLETPALEQIAEDSGLLGRVRFAPLEEPRLRIGERLAPIQLRRAGRYGSMPGLSLLDVWRARRVRGLLEGFRERLDPETPERVGSLDDRSVEEFCALYLGRRLLDRLYTPLLEGQFGLRASETSRALMLGLLGPEGGPALKLGLGLSSLVEGLASRLTDLRTRHRVSVVRPDGRGVELDSGGTLAARAVVLAVPAREARDLLTGLSPLEALFLESAEYAPRHVAIVPGRLETGDSPSVLWLPRSEGGPLASLVSLPALPGELGAPGHTLLVSRPDTRCDKPQELQEALVRVGTRLWSPLPGAGFARLFSSPRFAARFPVGRYSLLARFRQRWEREQRARRVALCGDYLVAPHAEGAAVSARRAAGEILSLLGD